MCIFIPLGSIFSPLFPPITKSFHIHNPQRATRLALSRLFHATLHFATVFLNFLMDWMNGLTRRTVKIINSYTSLNITLTSYGLIWSDDDELPVNLVFKKNLPHPINFFKPFCSIWEMAYWSLLVFLQKNVYVIMLFIQLLPYLFTC